MKDNFLWKKIFFNNIKSRRKIFFSGVCLFEQHEEEEQSPNYYVVPEKV
jgi:hypothetical protein